MVNELEEYFANTVQPRFPNLQFIQSGDLQERGDTQRELQFGFLISMAIILAILMVGLRSWLQPMLILGAVPFGIVGAIAGHWLLGLQFSILSFMGVVALTGVVVNDGLVLVDGINRRRKRRVHAGGSDAGLQDRFRPILRPLSPLSLASSPHVRNQHASQIPDSDGGLLGFWGGLCHRDHPHPDTGLLCDPGRPQKARQVSQTCIRAT